MHPAREWDNTASRSPCIHSALSSPATISLFGCNPWISLRAFQCPGHLAAMKLPSIERVASRLTPRGERRASPYHYSPIDKEASEIRLLTLLPGVFGTKIRITIRSTVLSKSLVPEYEALSYVWGSTKRKACVYIQEAEGESTMGITRNLDEALQKLRYEDEPRTLWIDAICVDQSNIPELGHQVVQMADIYPQATRVVIWLGPERNDSALAMRRLNALGSTVEVNWDLFQIKHLSSNNYDQWSNEPLPFLENRKILASIKYFLRY